MKVALGVVLPGANLLTVLCHRIGHVKVATGVKGQGVRLFSPVRVALGVVLPGGTCSPCCRCLVGHVEVAAGVKRHAWACSARRESHWAWCSRRKLAYRAAFALAT